jgi:hypothetical protein
MLETRVKKSLSEAPERGEVQLTDLVIELALERLTKAFDGRSFSISDLRRIAQTAEFNTKGKEWKALRLAHTTSFDGMKRSTLCDLALTAVQFFELTRDVWHLLPPSRLRRVLAAQCHDGVRWVVGLEEDTDADKAAAVLRETYNFEPRTAEEVVDGIEDGIQTIGIRADRKDQWEKYFQVQRDQPAWPRIG